MAGCESRDGKVSPVLFFHESHRGRQYRIVRLCTSDFVEYPNLFDGRGALGFDVAWSLWGFGGRALGFAREKLAALVFEGLEAVLLSVWMLAGDACWRCLLEMSAGDGRMDLPRQLLEDLQGRHIKRT